jgi:hypothetical protein
MTTLTQSQLNTIRDPNGQYTNLYLAKFEPRILMQAQINDANIVKGAQVITFDNVITGSYTNLTAGQSVYIGSTQGGYDIGRVRLRSITSTQLTVAVDDGIFYADNQYITVREFYEIWPVFPFTSLNTGTKVPTFYKDWDITYSDQNVNFDPVIIMGPDFAGFYDTLTGSSFYAGSIFFSATGSYTVDGSTISSYSWNFPAGCTITGSTLGTPGNVGFSGPGMYVVRCAVTASNGKTAIAYRHILLLNHHYGPPEGDPILNYEEISDWEFGQLTTDNINGAIANITVRSRANEFKDGDLVIIFREDYYAGGVLQSFGGFPGRENILFVGYIDKADTTYDSFISKTDFILKGTASYLQNKEMFSVQVQDTQGSPADWTYIKNMTIQKALIHYMRWHSTLLSVKDFNALTTAQGSYHEDVIIFQKGEILSNLTNFMQQKLMGFISSDRQGEFFTEIDLQILVTGSRPASVMTLQEGDWLGETKISEIIENPISNVLVGGIAYDPTVTAYLTGVPLLSRAPGQWQSYVGKSQNVSGLTISSAGQTEVNQISGLYYAKENNDTPDVELDLAYNMPNIDIYPQSFYDFNISGTAQVYRGFNWKPKRLIPRKETIKLDKFVLRQIITFETETYGPPGDTVIIPVTVPGGDCTDCGTPPPCDCVKNPSCDGCPPIVGVGDKNSVFAVSNNIIGFTQNFLSVSPHWVDKTNGLSGMKDFILDPWNPVNIAYCVAAGGGAIYKTTNLQSNPPTWTSILTPSSISPNCDQFYRVVATIQSNGFITVLGSLDSAGIKRPVVYHSSDGGVSWSGYDFGAIATAQTGFPAQVGCFAISQNNVNNIYVGTGNGTGRLWRSTNGGVSFSIFYVVGGFYPPYDIQIPFIAGSSTDDIIFVGGGRDSTTDAYIKYSSNAGGSFSDVSPTIVHGSYTDGIGVPDPNVNNRQMVSYVGSSSTLFLLGTRSTDKRGGYEEPHLLVTTDAGATWTLAHSFTGSQGSGNGYVTNIGLWPYDSNSVFALGNNDDGYILYSTDGGVTFTDKIGDWVSVFGANTQPGNHNGVTNQGRRMIVPIWLAY